ncbi:hypothetical protein QJS04_geneDACA024268 [Acorus gramineus]|uniref:Uncharacterized protein n=1 Tax=Acorus gramineus TaxID=55184 RepID=A0AAV9BPN9_ACOGR|nr:hypothetical protein QJS04_geneDACA024268 [Acorus gramineus]
MGYGFPSLFFTLTLRFSLQTTPARLRPLLIQALAGAQDVRLVDGTLHIDPG